MAKSVKQYSPALQLVLIFGLYIAFLILWTLISSILCRVLTGLDLTGLRHADLSVPGVSLAWKVITFLDPLFYYLLPALLFVRIVSTKLTDWYDLQTPVGLSPTIVIIVILLLSLPISDFLYTWNSTWGIAQSSLSYAKEMTTVSNTLMKMPHIGYLLLNLITLVLVPAIARGFFFRGVIQKILINMMPKYPWIAILIAATIFGASYFQWQWFTSCVLIGFELGAIYYLTENLWISILADFVFNSVAMFQFFGYERGWTDENPNSPTGAPWYLALISLILTIGLLWYFRRKIPTPVAKVAYQDDIASIGK